jgi:hypothetical protein
MAAFYRPSSGRQAKQATSFCTFEEIEPAAMVLASLRDAGEGPKERDE